MRHRAGVPVQLSSLYAAYKAWSEAVGEKPMGNKTFSQALLEQDYRRTTSNGVWYAGIGLRNNTPDEGT